jgi:RNA polymerase sigma-70 factor, ECF subfamily
MDAAEFDAFYTASYRRIVAQICAMTEQPDVAPECVQEAFARAWAHRRRFSRKESPEAWVRSTAYRLALGRLTPDLSMLHV